MRGKSVSRVALIGENSIGYVNVLIDIWNNGDCAVLIDWRIPFITAASMMEDAKVCKCFIEKSLFENNKKHLPLGIEFKTFDKENNYTELLPERIYEKYKSNYSTDEAIVLYSSGTTGKSKGIILTHYAISTNADAIMDYMKPTKEDCIYIVKALTHSSTLTGELLVALKRSMKLVIAPTIVLPRVIFRNIQKFGVTIICVNPTLLQKYSYEYASNEYALPTLRAIYVSGSVLSDKVYHLSHKIFGNIPIYNVYGLSEAGPRVSAQTPESSKTNSVGKPIKGVEILILDDNQSPVAHCTKGRIYIKSKSLFMGYLNSNSALVSTNKDDMLCSGDIGHINSVGELVIDGRADSIVLYQSHNIIPESIENEIMNNSVITACRVYVENDLLCCDYTTESEVCLDNADLVCLNKTLEAILPRYEIPVKYVKVDRLNNTLTGKISRG